MNVPCIIDNYLPDESKSVLMICDYMEEMTTFSKAHKLSPSYRKKIVVFLKEILFLKNIQPSQANLPPFSKKHFCYYFKTLI